MNTAREAPKPCAWPVSPQTTCGEPVQGEGCYCVGHALEWARIQHGGLVVRKTA